MLPWGLRGGCGYECRRTLTLTLTFILTLSHILTLTITLTLTLDPNPIPNTCSQQALAALGVNSGDTVNIPDLVRAVNRVPGDGGAPLPEVAEAELVTWLRIEHGYLDIRATTIEGAWRVLSYL